MSVVSSLFPFLYPGTHWIVAKNEGREREKELGEDEREREIVLCSPDCCDEAVFIRAVFIPLFSISRERKRKKRGRFSTAFAGKKENIQAGHFAHVLLR